jgi:hypothetical protein
MKSVLIASFCALSLYLSSYAQEHAPDGSSDYWNELYKSVINTYGFDQVLVNGIIYEDNYRGKIGHPFLLEDQFYKGTLVFREKEYKGINIKYDIYKQQVVLYVMQNNSVAWVIPPNDFITAFSLGEKLFVKHAFHGEPRFYQMVYDTEKLKCLYYWSKLRYDSDHNSEYISAKFTKSERITYLMADGVFTKYRNNRSFVSLFPHEHQIRIKQYIKTTKINVARSSDGMIHELLSYCNSLP